MPAKIFFCYAYEDEALLNKLKTHLRPLQRQNPIDIWYDRNISAGSVWEEDIKKHLNEADIILLLISPSFIDSDYCYGIELQRAIERHKEGNVRVIPIILEYVYWQFEPLSSLQALPVDAKPIVTWLNQNEAFYNVGEGIRKVVTELSLAQILQTVQLKNILTGHTHQVNSVAISPDGQIIVGGSNAEISIGTISNDETIKVWNLHSGTLLRTLKGHTIFAYGVNAVAISPDGHTIVSGSADSTVKIWSL